MGIVYLFQSPSIRPHIRRVLCNPRLSTNTHENNLLSEVELALHLFDSIFAADIIILSKDLCYYLIFFRSDITDAMVNPFRDSNSCVTEFGS